MNLLLGCGAIAIVWVLAQRSDARRLVRSWPVLRDNLEASGFEVDALGRSVARLNGRRAKADPARPLEPVAQDAGAMANPRKSSTSSRSTPSGRGRDRDGAG